MIETSGGSSLFKGFIDRIKIDIGKYYGGKYKNRMKVIEVYKRNLLQYIGASTFSLNQIFKVYAQLGKNIMNMELLRLIINAFIRIKI